MGDACDGPGSVAGAASQHDRPCVHVGLEPAGAVHQRPKYESNEWFSWTIRTTCSIFDARHAPATQWAPPLHATAHAPGPHDESVLAMAAHAPWHAPSWGPHAGAAPSSPASVPPGPPFPASGVPLELQADPVAMTSARAAGPATMARLHIPPE
jgi:hypothetical protein